MEIIGAKKYTFGEIEFKSDGTAKQLIASGINSANQMGIAPISNLFYGLLMACAVENEKLISKLEIITKENKDLKERIKNLEERFKPQNKINEFLSNEWQNK